MSSSRSIPFNGLRRLKAVIAPGGPIPVGRSTSYAGIKTGRFPPPVRFGALGRITAWREEHIQALIETGHWCNENSDGKKGK
jgi:prophage regulatory protein